MGKDKIILSESYSIGFNRRTQRNELNVNGIWLGAVRQMTTLRWNDWKDEENIEGKLYFVTR